ncbi:MAG TPA: hypothetical protein VM537_31840 [Anaerolineae bacterium]|nr:hypothetical protein [Anaerolineae bacterium]
MDSGSWVTTDFVTASLIGVLVLADIYMLQERIFGFPSPQARRAGGVFAGAAGMLTTLYLLQDPELLQGVFARLAVGFLGVVLATVLVLRRVDS